MMRRMALMFLVLASAAGCSGKKESPQPAVKESAAVAQPVEITLWHSYRATEKDAIDMIAADFNAASAAVKLKLLAVPYDAFADKITAAVPRGHGPDLFIFAHDRIGDWAESKIIEPIDMFVSEQLLSAFLETSVKALAYKNSLYGLPVALKCTVLYYNRYLVEKPPATTGEMIETARKLTSPKDGRYGLVYENSRFYFHAPFAFAFGASVFDASGNPALSSAEHAKALSYVDALAKKHGVVPAEVSSVLVTSLFNESKAAMAINGSWFLGEIDPSIKFAVATLPVLDETGKPLSPFLGSEALIMSSKSGRKKEAFEVMKFLASEKAALARVTKGRQVVPNLKIYDDPQVKGDEVIQVFRRQLDASVPMPNTPEMRMVWTPMDNAISKVLMGKSKPADALAEAQKAVETYMKGAKEAAEGGK